jgi:putative endopeptidase
MLAAGLNALRAEDAPPSPVSDIDPSVSPANDFYHYADGLWLKTVKIPADQSRWGTIESLREDEADKIRTLCERASATTGSGASIEQIVGDLYASGMDPDQIAESGSRPLEFEFDRIDAMETPRQVWAEIGHLHAIGVPVGFEFGSRIDPHHSDRVIGELSQGGLGLPDRDYYTDAGSADLRAKYLAHVSRMLVLRGATAAKAATEAAAILRIETALAGAAMTRTERRDPDATYHYMSRAELQQLAPNLDWDGLFRSLDLSSLTGLNVAQPDFVKELAHQIDTVPVDDWQAYLRWHVLHEFANALTDPYVNENFAFYGSTLSGTKRMPPRWHQIAANVNSLVGDAVGKLYVASYFSPETRTSVQELIAKLRATYRERLDRVEWMDASTRERAVAKLDAMRIQVGYPDHWRDYAGLSVDRGPYVTNVLKIKAFNTRFDLRKIGRPPDLSEWWMTPQTVNASYSQERNAIVVPAGWLQPPLFDLHGDIAANYGSLVAVIGHEMTHGFDDQGRKYNAKGELEDWWSPECAAQFKRRAESLAKQFDASEPEPGVFVNGRLTSGENIADLGGLKLAFTTLEAAMTTEQRTSLNGFTPEQRFFLSYAEMRKTKYRTAALLMQLKTDPHPPAQFRTNVPLSNLDEFAAAFSVPSGAPMRRAAADQVSIW